jgi:murein DD-endopeptidase MepM/ murein hydrolase activator NlpD
MRRRLAALVSLATLAVATACAVPRWPVDGPVSSAYGLRRDGLALRIHHGVDIVVPTGTPVRAMAPGRVRFAGTLSGYGQVVMIDHARGVRTVYAHLSEIHVRTGEQLDGRPVIGLSGATGRATGPHLHFEIHRRGRSEDPVPLLGSFPLAR